MKRKIIYVFLFLTFFSGLGFAQNLVPNPSFEQYDTCPHGASQFTGYVKYWFNPTLGTPDYYNTCFDTASHPWYNIMDVPVNMVGSQNAKTGNEYAGFMACENVLTSVEYREYIEIKLTSPLQAGKKYDISFYISLADSSNYATSRIGAYFSMDSLLNHTSYELLDNPQIQNTDGNFLSDKSNWSLISGEFMAIGGEQYITIGNFYTDSNTDTLFVSGGGDPALYNYPYYYIDEISVMQNSATVISDLGNTQNPQDEILLYPNPAYSFTEINFNISNAHNVDLKVYNILGQKLIDEKISRTPFVFDTKQLPGGLYSLEFIIDSKILCKKLFVFN